MFLNWECCICISLQPRRYPNLLDAFIVSLEWIRENSSMGIKRSSQKIQERRESNQGPLGEKQELWFVLPRHYLLFPFPSSVTWNKDVCQNDQTRKSRLKKFQWLPTGSLNWSKAPCTILFKVLWLTLFAFFLSCLCCKYRQGQYAEFGPDRRDRRAWGQCTNIQLYHFIDEIDVEERSSHRLTFHWHLWPAHAIILIF